MTTVKVLTRCTKCGGAIVSEHDVIDLRRRLFSCLNCGREYGEQTPEQAPPIGTGGHYLTGPTYRRGLRVDEPTADPAPGRQRGGFSKQTSRIIHAEDYSINDENLGGPHA